MTQLRVAWTLAVSVLTTGPVADHVLVSVGGEVEDMVGSLTETAVVFPQVPPGVYVATVQLIGLDGAAIGPPARTTPFAVHPEMTMLMVVLGGVGR